jgi:hypothetical protein
MPKVWSWNHIVVARWSFWYWNTAVPGGHPWCQRSPNLARNSS